MPSAPIPTHLQLVAGDDCKAADGRALSWTSDTWPPNLYGATLSMVVGHDQYNLYGNLPVTWTGTATIYVYGALVTGGNIPVGADATITLDVTSAQTVVLPPDEYDYTLTATLTDGDKATLAAGKLTVLAAPGTIPLYPPAV